MAGAATTGTRAGLGQLPVPPASAAQAREEAELSLDGVKHVRGCAGQRRVLIEQVRAGTTAGIMAVSSMLAP